MNFWNQQHPWMNAGVGKNMGFMGQPINPMMFGGQEIQQNFGMENMGGPLSGAMQNASLANAANASGAMNAPNGMSPVMDPMAMAQFSQQEATGQGQFAPNAPMNAGMNHGQMGSTGTPQLSGAQGFGFAMQGLQALGNLWGMIQQNKMAKAQLALQKEAYETNMNNTIKTYNTALSDRINARMTMEGRPGDAKGYLEENRLVRSKPS